MICGKGSHVYNSLPLNKYQESQMLQFKRIYVRRYSDSGQVVAYADHDKGRTEGSLSYEGTRRPRIVFRRSPSRAATRT